MTVPIPEPMINPFEPIPDDAGELLPDAAEPLPPAPIEAPTDDPGDDPGGDPDGDPDSVPDGVPEPA